MGETHKSKSPDACASCFTDRTIGSEVDVTICRSGRMILHPHFLMSSTPATMQKYFLGTSTPQRGSLAARGHVKVDWTVEAEATRTFGLDTVQGSLRPCMFACARSSKQAPCLHFASHADVVTTCTNPPCTNSQSGWCATVCEVEVANFLRTWRAKLTSFRQTAKTNCCRMPYEHEFLRPCPRSKITC